MEHRFGAGLYCSLSCSKSAGPLSRWGSIGRGANSVAKRRQLQSYREQCENKRIPAFPKLKCLHKGNNADDHCKRDSDADVSKSEQISSKVGSKRTLEHSSDGSTDMISSHEADNVANALRSHDLWRSGEHSQYWSSPFYAMSSESHSPPDSSDDASGWGFRSDQEVLDPNVFALDFIQNCDEHTQQKESSTEAEGQDASDMISGWGNLNDSKCIDRRFASSLPYMFVLDSPTSKNQSPPKKVLHDVSNISMPGQILSSRESYTDLLQIVESKEKHENNLKSDCRDENYVEGVYNYEYDLGEVTSPEGPLRYLEEDYSSKDTGFDFMKSYMQ